MIVQQGYELWAVFAGNKRGEWLTGLVVAWHVLLDEKCGGAKEARPIVPRCGDIPTSDVIGYYTDNVSALVAVRAAKQQEAQAA